MIYNQEDFDLTKAFGYNPTLDFKELLKVDSLFVKSLSVCQITFKLKYVA